MFHWNVLGVGRCDLREGAGGSRLDFGWPKAIKSSKKKSDIFFVEFLGVRGRVVPNSSRETFFGDRYDWTTGVPDSGNDWRKFRALPRSYPLRSLVFYIV